MNADPLYRPRIGFPLRYIQQDQHYILIHSHQPVWVLVNESGFSIARLCDGSCTVQGIARKIAGDYHIGYQQAVEDVKAFLSALKDKGWFRQPESTKNKPPPALRSVFVEITECCNLRCKHCYTASEPTPSAEIPTAKILNIIDELSHLGGVEITLSGGEPLTHPDIVGIIQYAVKKLRVQLLTNGTLIDKEMACLLADLGVKVQVSLDGSTAEVHDRIRGKGTYTRAKQGIELLKSAGVQVKLNLCTVIMKDNLNDLLNMVRLAQEWGLPLLRFIPLHCAGRARMTWEQNQPSPAEHIDFFYQVFAQPHIDLQVSSGLSGLVFSSPQQRVQDRWCPLGRKLDISRQGNVYPCVFMMEERFCLGNIYHRKLADIFYSAKLKHLAQDCAARREKIARCRECLWHNFCQAGCPSLAYAHTGSLWGIDHFCQLRQELYPQIIFSMAHKKMGGKPKCS